MNDPAQDKARYPNMDLVGSIVIQRVEVFSVLMVFDCSFPDHQ